MELLRGVPDGGSGTGLGDFTWANWGSDAAFEGGRGGQARLGGSWRNGADFCWIGLGARGHADAPDVALGEA